MQIDDLSPSLAQRGQRRLARRRTPWFLMLPALGLAALVILPLVYLVIRALEADWAVSDLIWRERTADVLVNTAVLAFTVGVTAGGLALPAAWLTARTTLAGARIIGPACTLPLVIPSYVGALTFVVALGPSGYVSDWLEDAIGISSFPSIYGFTGTWLVLSLFTFPYVFLTVSASFGGIDPSHEEAARSLGKGPFAAFFSTTFRQLRPALASGMLLAALYAVSDFGVVTLLRYDSLTRAIFVQYQSAFDRSYAAVLSLLLVGFAVLLVVADTAFRGRAAYHRLGAGVGRRKQLVDLGWWALPAALYLVVLLGLSLVLPLSVLVHWVWRAINRGESFSGLWTGAQHTILLSGAAATLTILAALPVAILAVRYGDQFGRAIERFTYLGYGLPGIVIALAFVFLGANYLPNLYQTIPLLLIAYIVRFSPQAVGSTSATLEQVNPRLEDAARSLGRSAAGSIRSVTLPLAWPGMAAGFALVFLTVSKELPVTLLLRPTGFDTLATEVWTAAGTGAFSGAAGPALLLIAISAVPSMVVFSRIRRLGVRGENE